MERFSGFDGDDDESGGNGDFTFNVDGTNNDADHRPSTPRSKHSAMEQRRRSKINERFQTLRELIPHSDQKRDKASLLLEVIEHIRSLHEKVQKYESSYPGPGWIEENAKSMPWGEVYFRSCWKNAQNNSACPGDGIVDPSQDVQNGSLSPGFILSRNDTTTPIPVPSVAQNLTENDINAGVSFQAAENTSGFAREVAASSVPHPNLYSSVSMIDGVSQSQQLISDADNMASLSDTPWLRSPFLPDCPIIDDTLNGQELGINEGTISVSCAYSNGLLTTLSRTLQSSGIDLSQASISVDINLGKRATSRRPSVTTTMSTAKEMKCDPTNIPVSSPGRSETKIGEGDALKREEVPNLVTQPVKDLSETEVMEGSILARRFAKASTDLPRPDAEDDDEIGDLLGTLLWAKVTKPTK